MKTTKFVLLGWLVAAIGCTSLDDNEKALNAASRTEDKPSKVSYLFTPEEAYSIALNFRNQIDTCKKDQIEYDFASAEISVISSDAKSRSESELETVDTLMYAINFPSDCGFALVAADRRIDNHMLGVGAKGKFNLPTPNSVSNFYTEYNVGVVTYIDMAKEYVERELLILSNDLPTLPSHDPNLYGQVVLPWTPSPGDSVPQLIGDWTIIYAKLPILKTKWNQSDRQHLFDYGMLCPNNIAGCVPVAAAQILSHFEYPSHIEWNTHYNNGSVDLDWHQIIADCINYRGRLRIDFTHQSLIQVASLLRYLGVAFESSYGTGETSSSTDNLISWFNNQANLSATQLSDYNEQAIKNAICNEDIPVYIEGDSHRHSILLGLGHYYSGGHSWVLDGYIYAHNRTTSTNSMLFHCNWGWGGSEDGYYLSDVFNAASQPAIGDERFSRDDDDTDYYYQYRLKYSIIREI